MTLTLCRHGSMNNHLKWKKTAESIVVSNMEPVLTGVKKSLVVGMVWGQCWLKLRA